jgi:glutaredoxin 3
VKEAVILNNMSDKTRVTIYSTSWCAYCPALKAYLKSRGVDFDEVDVEHDREAMIKLVQKTGVSAVPVTEIGDETILGFDRPRIDLALRHHKLA